MANMIDVLISPQEQDLCNITITYAPYLQLTKSYHNPPKCTHFSARQSHIFYGIFHISAAGTLFAAVRNAENRERFPDRLHCILLRQLFYKFTFTGFRSSLSAVVDTGLPLRGDKT